MEILDLMKRYAEEFGYTFIEDVIRTQYGDIRVTFKEDELVLSQKYADDDEDHRSSLTKIKKHFAGRLRQEVERNKEETPEPIKEEKKPEVVETPKEPLDNLGRPYPKIEEKVPKHFTKGVKKVEKKETTQATVAPVEKPSEPEISGTIESGDVQRAAAEGIRKAEKAKETPSLDDIMDGAVEKPAPEKAVPKPVPVVQPKPEPVKPEQSSTTPGVFRKAERKKAKLRLSLSGFSGSGKTVSALLIAYGITKNWGKIAIVDSEGKSAELYVGAKIGTVVIGQYDVLEMEPPFLVDKLVTAIKMAETAGYEVLIIDSASPYWQGEGGGLESHSEAVKRGANSFVAWGPVTAKQNKLMDTIIGSKIHILATLRSKVEYIMETSGGRTQVRKIGTEPIQRQGFIYDMTMQLDLAQDHVAEVVKDRTNLFDQQHFVPNVEMGEKLREWLEYGK